MRKVLIGLLLVLSLAFGLRGVQAATYSDPWWTSASPSPECASAGAELPAEWVYGASVRTGEVRENFFLFRTPGRLEDNLFGLVYRSMTSGSTQFGRGMHPSWEHTVQKVILDVEHPDDVGGHEAQWRRADGLLVTYDWDGDAYSTSDCRVRHTLTTNGSGRYVLTDTQGNTMTFDANGMPDVYEDRNGNQDDFTYDSSLRWTSYTDDRGKTYTIHHDGSGFVDYLEDFTANRWTFSYDSAGNLTQILTPATTDQPGGITTTLGYDSGNRLTSVQDGRGHIVRAYAYVGSTGQVDAVTLDGQTVDFAYVSGRTDVTDRLGNVRRYYYSGPLITKTEMYVAGVARFVAEYRYSGDELATIVLPLGNRIDFTCDGDGNVTERRKKTTDTSSTSTDDIVESWEFTSGFVISYVDSLGNETTYTRDGSGNVTAIDYPTVSNPSTQAASLGFTVNAYGQVEEIEDEEGKTTTYTYFASGSNVGLLQKSEVDAAGLDLTTTYAYDTSGNVTSVTDANGHTTTTSWDSLRRKTQRQSPSPLSYLTKYAYDANGNLLQMDVENRDKNGTLDTSNSWFTTSYTYTNLNAVATIVEEISSSTTRTTSFAYDAEQHRTSVTRPMGNVESWTWNERGMMASHTRGYGSPDASTVNYSYDDNGNPTAEQDGRSNTTTHTYDLFDRRTKTTSPLGSYAQWTYDENGNITEIARKDALNAVLLRRSFAFDQRGRLWQVSDLRTTPNTTYSDAVTTYLRFKTGHLDTVTDALGKTTSFDYDAAWRRTTATDALGNEYTWAYDDGGNLTDWSVKDENGPADVLHEYAATYDALDRCLTRVEIDSTSSLHRLTTTFAYDSRGNLVWRVDPAGSPTRWTFDGLSRPTQREVALGVGLDIETFTASQRTDWAYDANGRLTSLKSDAGDETTWSYDALDRPNTATWPNSATVSYAYDANGNVTQLTDAAGNVIANTYDALNRNTFRTVGLATGFIDTTNEMWVFDAADRVLTAQDNDTKVEFTYAVLGLSSRVYDQKQSYVGGAPLLRTMTMGWDANGHLSSLTYPSGLSLSYSRDDLGRLTSISDGTNTVASWTYVGTWRNVVTLQNGATATSTQGGFRSELASVHHQRSTPATLVRLDYGYDAQHSATYERFGASGSSGDAFAHDMAGRLTTAWMGSSNPSAPTGAAYAKKIDFTLDDDANRSSVGVTPYGMSPSSTTYTKNNIAAYTAVGGIAYSIDGNGNVTNDGTYKYEYNYKNLLCRVRLASTNAQVASYKHDAFGNRVDKVVLGATTRFVYAGTSCATTCTTTGTWKQDFVYGDDPRTPLMLKQADVLDYDGDANTTELTRSFFHVGGSGNVMEVSELDEDEAVAYRYDPYGALVITRGGSTLSGDPLGQHFGYQGGFHDEETGLISLAGRTFHPAIGRCLQRDTVAGVAAPNPYIFACPSPGDVAADEKLPPGWGGWCGNGLPYWDDQGRVMPWAPPGTKPKPVCNSPVCGGDAPPPPPLPVCGNSLPWWDEQGRVMPWAPPGTKPKPVCNSPVTGAPQVPSRGPGHWGKGGVWYPEDPFGNPLPPICPIPFPGEDTDPPIGPFGPPTSPIPGPGSGATNDPPPPRPVPDPGGVWCPWFDENGKMHLGNDEKPPPPPPPTNWCGYIGADGHVHLPGDGYNGGPWRGGR